jgi:hypothetical protein
MAIWSENEEQSMHTLTNRRWIRQALPTGLLCVAALTGCSSSSGSSASTSSTTKTPATSTTHNQVAPVPPNASVIAADLSSSQNAFVSFERATKTLGSGSIPSKGTCQSIAKQLSPQSTGGPAAATAAIKGIQNTAIQFAAGQDVQNKLILLSACSQGTATKKMAMTAAASAAVITQELKALGISD